MTTLDDLDLMDATTPANHGAQRRRCKHTFAATGECLWCGHHRDGATARRGRNNRSRGNRDELTVARILGGSKVGELGLPWDVVVPGYLRVQAKKLGRWPSIAQVTEWLDAIPAEPELRAVALADTPGPGGRTRRLLVVDLEEFARWHGRTR